MIKNIVTVALCFLFGCFYAFSQEENPGNLKSKIKKLRDAKNFTQENIEYIDLLIDLGNALKYSTTDTVKLIAVETLELSTAIHYEKGRLESLLNYGYYELFTGNPDKAIYYYEQSLQGALTHKFQDLSIKAYNGIAQAHFIKAEYPDSYIHFLKSLEIAEEIDDLEMVIKMNANLGTMFSLLQDYEEALKFYEIAQTKFSEQTTTISKVSVLVNLGYLYCKIKEPERALDYLDKSIVLLQNVDASKILAFAYLTTAEVYNQTEHYEKALEILDKARAIYETVNDKKGEADMYYYSGIAHLNLHEIEKAEGEFLESMAMYRSFSLKTGLEKSYRALYKINKEKGLTAEALSHLELAQKYSDSVDKEKKKRNISMLNAKLSFEKSKADLAEHNQTALDRQEKYIQWTTIGLICALIISLLVFRANNTKKRLNQELVSQTAVLSKKQEELNKINTNQDKLFSIVGHDLRGPIVSLKQLLGLALEKDTEIQHFYRFGPKLRKDVDHIYFTLDNLLNWGLSQMQGNLLNPTEINIAEEFLEAESFFRDALDLKGLQIKQMIPQGLSIKVDANHFTLILRNLLSNAIKFTPENGFLYVTAYQNSQTIVISLKDQGVGMTKEVLGKIFKTEEHFTTFGTNNEPGTGLGLILCKEMIEKNKGHIMVTSELGKGSTFTLSFSNDS